MGDKKVLVVMAGRSTTGRQYGMLESLPEEARAPIQAALDEANVSARTYARGARGGPAQPGRLSTQASSLHGHACLLTCVPLCALSQVEIRTGLLSQDEETQRKWFGEAHAIIPAGLVDAELLDKCPNLALVSCGHRFCNGCMERIQRNGSTQCAYCRQQFTGTIPVFEL